MYQIKLIKQTHDKILVKISLNFMNIINLINGTLIKILLKYFGLLLLNTLLQQPGKVSKVEGTKLLDTEGRSLNVECMKEEKRVN